MDGDYEDGDNLGFLPVNDGEGFEDDDQDQDVVVYYMPSDESASEHSNAESEVIES